MGVSVFLRWFLGCGLMLSLVLAQANETAVIEPRYLTPQQMVQALKPSVDEGGSIVAYETQVIIASNPANIAALKQLAKELDKRSREVIVSVRYREPGKRVAPLPPPEVADHTYQASLLEGYRLLIRTGDSYPYVSGSGLREDAGQTANNGVVTAVEGFYLTPRLMGNHVLLRLVPKNIADTSGTVIKAKVVGRLGDWLEVGHWDDAGTPVLIEVRITAQTG